MPNATDGRCTCCADLWDMLDAYQKALAELGDYTGESDDDHYMYHSGFRETLMDKIRTIKLDIMIRHCGMFNPPRAGKHHNCGETHESV